MSAVQIVNKSLVNKLVGHSPEIERVLYRLIDNSDETENTALGDILTMAYMSKLDRKEREAKEARLKLSKVRLKKHEASDAYLRHTLEFLTGKNQFEERV